MEYFKRQRGSHFQVQKAATADIVSTGSSHTVSCCSRHDNWHPVFGDRFSTVSLQPPSFSLKLPSTHLTVKVRTKAPLIKEFRATIQRRLHQRYKNTCTTTTPIVLAFRHWLPSMGGGGASKPVGTSASQPGHAGEPAPASHGNQQPASHLLPAGSAY